MDSSTKKQELLVKFNEMMQKDDWEELPHLDVNPGCADPSKASFTAKRYL